MKGVATLTTLSPPLHPMLFLKNSSTCTVVLSTHPTKEASGP